MCFHGLTTPYGRSCTVAGILHHRLTSLGCGIALIYFRNGRALRMITHPIRTPGTPWHFESEPVTTTFGLMVAALGTSIVAIDGASVGFVEQHERIRARAVMTESTSASTVRGIATPEGFCGEARDTSRVAGESRRASADALTVPQKVTNGHTFANIGASLARRRYE